MAGRRSFLPSARLLLLLLVALGGAVLHGDGAVATGRPLLGIAEPPASEPRVAAGPVGVSLSEPGGGVRRHGRSQAGADVILAGFAAALVVVIFCYIRMTRASSGDVAPGQKQESLGGF